MYIDGEHDWMDHRAAEETVKTMNVPTKVVIVPEAGHHVHLDNPTQFDKVVAREMLETTCSPS